MSPFKNNLEVWKNIPAQMTVDIIQAPTPLVALDKNYLVYELNLKIIIPPHYSVMHRNFNCR